MSGLPHFTTAEDRNLYLLGLRLRRAIEIGTVSPEEAEEALIRAGYADPAEGSLIVEDGLNLASWLDHVEALFGHGQRLGGLMDEGLLDRGDVRRALKGVRDRSPEDRFAVKVVGRGLRSVLPPVTAEVAA